MASAKQKKTLMFVGLGLVALYFIGKQQQAGGMAGMIGPYGTGAGGVGGGGSPSPTPTITQGQFGGTPAGG